MGLEVDNEGGKLRKEIDMNLVHLLAVGGETATIFGIFITIYGLNNNQERQALLGSIRTSAEKADSALAST